MPEWAPIAVALLSLAVSVLLALTGRGREDSQKTLAYREANERRLTQLETKVELMFKDVSFAAAFAATSVLHREDDRNRLDALVDKYRHGPLSAEDLVEFVKRLQVAALGATTPQGEPDLFTRRAAETMLRVLEYEYNVGG